MKNLFLLLMILLTTLLMMAQQSVVVNGRLVTQAEIQEMLARLQAASGRK